MGEDNRGRRMKTRIKRKEESLKEEIKEILNALYNLEEKDDEIRYENMKNLKNEIIRGFIIHLHLALEDLLKELLIYRLKELSNKTIKVKEIKKFVEKDLRSHEIIRWSALLNLITKKEYLMLNELNRIRNICAHHWILDLPKYKKDKNKKKKIRVLRLTYKGKNLLNKDIFLDEFMPKYSQLYLKLFYRVFNIKV